MDVTHVVCFDHPNSGMPGGYGTATSNLTGAEDDDIYRDIVLQALNTSPHHDYDEVPDDVMESATVYVVSEQAPIRNPERGECTGEPNRAGTRTENPETVPIPRMTVARVADFLRDARRDVEQTDNESAYLDCIEETIETLDDALSEK